MTMARQPPPAQSTAMGCRGEGRDRRRGGPTAGDSHTDCDILSTSFHLTLYERGKEKRGGGGEEGRDKREKG